jgi:hypothetical protein
VIASNSTRDNIVNKKLTVEIFAGGNKKYCNRDYQKSCFVREIYGSILQRISNGEKYFKINSKATVYTVPSLTIEDMLFLPSNKIEIKISTNLDVYSH